MMPYPCRAATECCRRVSIGPLEFEFGSIPSGSRDRRRGGARLGTMVRPEEPREGREADDATYPTSRSWSRHFGTPAYGVGHPFLTRAAAEFLVERGVVLAGIDSLNIDDTPGGERPVHSLLLERDIRIVEHLTNLAELPDTGFRFFAVPVKVRGLGSFPVRAFALLSPGSAALQPGSGLSV